MRVTSMSKNDEGKPMRVVLLDENGEPEFAGHSFPVKEQGKVGFRADGFARVLYWADKAKTWKRAEEEK